ncbi:MAG: hypothetical protein MUE96_06385 [Bacteroidia bacterium]|jgi:hypothetical protein|nr:hypothetical protein [Bacteroidia bacterium]
MNKTILTIVIWIAAIVVQAQGIEIRPLAFYTFRETVPISAGQAIINDGATYGIELGYVAQQHLDIHLSYQAMPTTVDIRRFPSLVGDIGNNMLASYWQLGANRLYPLVATDKVIPYTGVKIGLGVYDFESAKVNTVYRAALGFQAGIKVMASPKIGLQLGMQLQSPISGLGMGVSAGTGGVSTGVSTYSYMFQFSLGGGLIFRLK